MELLFICMCVWKINIYIYVAYISKLINYICSIYVHILLIGLPKWLSGLKNPHAVQESQVQSLGQEDHLEEGMAVHSGILAWRIPRPEGPGRP